MTWLSPYNFLEIDQVGEVTVVKFITRAILGDNTIRLIGEELYRLVDKLGRKNLLVDFSEVRNLGSYMLATLINLNKKADAAGGKLALCAIDPELMRVFEMTQLHKVLKIYPGQAEALQTFEGQ